jgi:hypothetical protein
MTRLAAACLALALLAPAARAEEVVPVRVLVLKASRQGPAQLDRRLADLKGQVGKLAYVRWELVSEHTFQMAVKKTVFVDLPTGDPAGLTVQEARGEVVTVEVALAQRNTQSRLTIEKGQRILHQVSGEKGGVAYFVAVTAWP